MKKKQRIFRTRKQSSNAVINMAREWGQLQKARVHISPLGRADLLKATETFSRSLRSDLTSTVLLSGIQSELEIWQKGTERLRRLLWQSKKQPLKLKKSLKAVHIETVIKNYFLKKPSRVELAFPQVYLKRLLAGSIALSRSLEPSITKAVARDTELWFLWLTLIIAVLKREGVPSFNPKRKSELSPELIMAIEKLQSKLPKQRRSGPSLRQAVSRCAKIAHVDQISTMDTLLAHWSKGYYGTSVRQTHPSIHMLTFPEELRMVVLPRTKHPAAIS